MTTISIRLFISTPDCLWAAIRDVRWPAVPRVGEQVDAGGEPIAVEHVLWDQEGRATLELADRPEEDVRRLARWGWRVGEFGEFNEVRR